MMGKNLKVRLIMRRLRRWWLPLGISMLILWFGGVPPGFSQFPLFPKSPSEDKLKTLFEKLDSMSKVDLSKPLTLRECIDIALERSPDAILSRLSVITSELSLNDARSRYFPQIYLNGTYLFSDRIEFGFEKENYDLGLSASYTIWDHGHREAEVAQGREDLKAAQQRREGQIQQIIYDVTRAYYNLLKAQRLVEVDEEILRIARQNTERVRAFMEAGKKIEADVLAAEVREANDELQLVQDKNNLEIARADLAMAMGLDPASRIQVVDDTGYKRFIVLGKLEPEELRLDEAIDRALKNRAELKEMRAKIKAAEWGLFLAKIDRYPKITAEYSYDVNLDDYLRERESFKDHRSWRAVAKLSFPLFDGGVSRRREQRYEIQLRDLKECYKSLQRQIMLEVRQNYLNIMRTRKQLEILDKQVRNAKANLDVTTGRYEQEVATELEVAEARSLYAQAMTNRVRAYYDYKIAQAALRKAIGELR